MRSHRTVFGRTMSDEAHVFAAFDTDNSGQLSPLEIADGFKRLGLGLTARQVDALCDFMDVNGDGEIGATV